MDTEIELKLLVSGDVKNQLESSLLGHLGATHQMSEFTLYNQYFDTPDRLLGKHEIGFRVRNKGGYFEQTVKTAGKIVGGLHQRPEYNVQIDTNRPDLDLFDQEIWPDNLSISRVQASLNAIFKTNFTRTEYLLTYSDGSLVELVFDNGVIQAGDQKVDINEIELELKQGAASRLFDIADRISTLMPIQIGSLSKAARGYMLADDALLKPKPLKHALVVCEQDSCETGFIKAVEYALAFWQHHELCYLQSNKIKDLRGMLTGMRLLLQAITVYLPSLQCSTMLGLHKTLLSHINKWFWLEKSFGLKELRSPKGPYRKKLTKNEELVSYLRGLSEGLLNEYKPIEIIQSNENTLIQLTISRLLFEKPWREESTGSATKLTEHAKGWLSQGWHNVMQSMPVNKKIAAQDYIFQQSMLRQTLYNGFLFGSLFSEHRDQFRAPWLDLLEGIDDLKTLTFLQEQLVVSDLEERQDLLDWSEEKITNLLSVMEQSRKVAVRMEPYW